MKKVLLISLIVIPVLFGCKKDPVPEVNPPTLEERARDGLYDLMKYVYLWYNTMPTVKVSDYDGPEEILEALRYLPRDKWSFVTDYESFMASMQGSFVGHGIRLSLDNAGNVRVVSLYEGSDLWPKGVRRGWIVKEITANTLLPSSFQGTTQPITT
jgi:hypothetical protein